MNETASLRSTPLSLSAKYCSKVLPPAVVIVVLLVLAGSHAGLGLWGTLALVAGVAVIPGLIHKKAKPWFRSRGLADHWRTDLVAVLMGLGWLTCLLLGLPEPVPATVGALFVGNAALSFSRRWLNVSAHVSVITFGGLWISAIYAGGWLWLLLLSPLMLVSRVSLREHTLREALSGMALGLATFCCFYAATTWS